MNIPKTQHTDLLVEEHQLVLMALALLASSNQVMAVALRDIARKLEGEELFEYFLGQWDGAPPPRPLRGPDARADPRRLPHS